MDVDRERSDAEEMMNTHDNKVSDSGYSNSCSNSQSQRSSGSLESRHSSSSGSSGYCGHQSTLGSVSECPEQCKRKERQEHKKKKNKGGSAPLQGCNGDAQGTTAPTKAASAPPAPQNNKKEGGGDVLSGIARTPNSDSEALHIAALSQTLSCIKKHKAKELPDGSYKDDVDMESAPCKFAMDNHEQIIKYLQAEIIHAEGLYMVVSLRDGVILYTSANLTDLLGYPKDMWVGRSLIDFVYPKHRVAFASHITSVIAQPHDADSNGKRSTFSCCLRRYRGLMSSGFSVTNKTVSYLPCQMTTSFKEVAASDDLAYNKIYLVISASVVRSAYKFGDESKCGGKFMTRHEASSRLSHVDPEVTSYFGFLPQDMIGRSIFDFYHPEDLHLLKEIYEMVMKEHGHLLRSKPYRFRCQNGGFVLLETEWSSFINPWSKKLEFIIGQHTVVRGPSNPDVTTPVHEVEPLQVSDEVINMSKVIQEEIITILDQTVGTQSREAVKQVVSKRCKDLASFMETLMDSRPPELKVDVLTEDRSISERDSVMLGEISPHHDYFNSKASSETPPSYNQLNYNENLQRFFESRPKTTLSDESNSDLKSETAATCASVDPATPTVPTVATLPGNNNPESQGEEYLQPASAKASQQRPCCSMNDTSSGQSTEESNSNANSADSKGPNKNTAASKTGGYHPPTLTEKILTKHNEDMEKQMMKKHREARSKSEKSKDLRGRNTAVDKDDSSELQQQGIKRSVPLSWEGEPFKARKQGHHRAQGAGPGGGGGLPSSTPLKQPLNNINSLLPPFSLPLPQRLGVGGPGAVLPPVYYPPYVDNPHRVGTDHHTAFPAYLAPPGVQYVPGMVYHPLMFASPPVVYSPLTVLPSPVFPTTRPMHPLQVKCEATEYGGTQTDRYKAGGRAYAGCVLQTLGGGIGAARLCATLHDPALLGATIKAEPPSSLQQAEVKSANLAEVKSATLAEVKNANIAEAPCQQRHLAAGPRDNKRETDADSNNTSNVFDDSSIYSSFYSLLRTDDKSDDSARSSPDNETKLEDVRWGEKKGGATTRRRGRLIKKVAPWLEEISVTSDLVLKYQMEDRNLQDVLNQDLKALERITQPGLVNDQLSQMYVDLELEGLSRHLTLEDGITSSSESSSDEYTLHKMKKVRYMEYDKMAILFEENAPLPPPAPAAPKGQNRLPPPPSAFVTTTPA